MQYLPVYYLCRLVLVGKKLAIMTRCTSAILSDILKARVLSMTSLRSLVNAPNFNDNFLTEIENGSLHCSRLFE